MARHFGAAHDIAAVGVAAAGFIDRDRANVIHAPNIAWRNEPLKAILEARIDVPVTIENDANAAGWAEFRFGAGRDVDDMVMLTMGTGVGGAVDRERSALPRRPRHRRRARPHPLHPRRAAVRLRAERMPRAVCVRSRPAARGERDRGRRGHRRRAGGRSAREKGSISGPAVSRLVLAGDPGAVEALRRVATALGEACGGFQAVLDPELFVIGGGVAQLGEDLLGPVRIAYETSLPGYGDRPIAEFAIAAARQRRRPHRRRRPRDRGGRSRCSTG